jgi:hypothetical protein
LPPCHRRGDVNPAAYREHFNRFLGNFDRKPQLNITPFWLKEMRKTTTCYGFYEERPGKREMKIHSFGVGTTEDMLMCIYHTVQTYTTMTLTPYILIS